MTGFLDGYGAQFAYVLDAETLEGRHWNNDGILEDVATGSAAGCVAAFLLRHGRAGDGEERSLAQGRFAGRPSRIAITAHGSPGAVRRVTVGGDVGDRRQRVPAPAPRGGGVSAPPIRVIDADALRRAVTLRDLIEPTAAALAEFSQGLGEAPVTVFAPAGDAGDVHVKSAWLGGHAIFTVKVASWFAARAADGRPASSGHITIHSASTGDLIAILHDEHYLTDIRTAAAGAVATRLLARPDATRLAVLGTGVQGRLQVAAACAVRPIDTVVIWGRRPLAAAAMRDELLDSHPALHVALAADARGAVRGADVIVTATGSRDPVVSGAWLEPGQHITALGADDPTKAELDPACFARADVLVVDSREAASQFGGDLRRAIDTQAISPQGIHAELGDILNGSHPGRRDAREITVAKLTGLGVQDLAAAEVVLSKLDAALSTVTR